MRTHEQFMAELQPIIERLAGTQEAKMSTAKGIADALRDARCTCSMGMRTGAGCGYCNPAYFDDVCESDQCPPDTEDLGFAICQEDEE